MIQILIIPAFLISLYAALTFKSAIGESAKRGKNLMRRIQSFYPKTVFFFLHLISFTVAVMILWYDGISEENSFFTVWMCMTAFLHAFVLSILWVLDGYNEGKSEFKSWMGKNLSYGVYLVLLVFYFGTYVCTPLSIFQQFIQGGKDEKTEGILDVFAEQGYTVLSSSFHYFV